MFLGMEIFRFSLLAVAFQDFFAGFVQLFAVLFQAIQHLERIWNGIAAKSHRVRLACLLLLFRS